ncbi:MAG: putative metal-binding motif-containing protein [Methyloprofundus sp.]|nr:putative metal-binding motif-containing protein [Methyloprofundus sp.]
MKFFVLRSLGIFVFSLWLAPANAACLCGSTCNLTLNGPITLTSDVSYTACETITIGSGITVGELTKLTLNAGLGVNLSPVFSAEKTSQLSVIINPDLACDGDSDSDGINQCMDCNDNDPAVYPGAPDIPDAAYIDNNCDGIDGDIDQAVFVSSLNGMDTNNCGLIDSPCLTIAKGIEQANLMSMPSVFVEEGSYNEVINLANGISIYGAFDGNWNRPASSDTIITGGLYNQDNSYTVFHARNVTSTLTDLVLIAPDASGVDFNGGRSSYGINAVDSALTLARLSIEQGDGADGSAGTAGTNASQPPPLAAFNGENAGFLNTYCNDSRRGAGGGKAINAACLSDTQGGDGGDGGLMDRDCSPFSGNSSATLGRIGNNADGNGGVGGSRGSTCKGSRPGAGTNGNSIDGLGGISGKNFGAIINNHWYALSGHSGSLGTHGTGGGGGGGSGGCDLGIDDFGAGGGGGGAGGCRAVSAGSGGIGGGGSFGIFSVGGSLNINDVNFIRGNGGKGGNGGAGALGQPGGLGGSGGLASSDTNPGGNGGNGERGGHSGGGGGGSGGNSFCVYTYLTAVSTSDYTCSGGFAGFGGSGGAGEVGNTLGYSGDNGVIDTISVCNTPQSCNN